MFPARRSPSPEPRGVLALARHDRRDRRGEAVIHVGRMPRTDTFQIGVEVLPRGRDHDAEREPRPST